MVATKRSLPNRLLSLNEPCRVPNALFHNTCRYTTTTPAVKNNKASIHNSFWICGLLAGLFFFYYASLSNYLPLGAGPDFRAHNDVTAFIVQYGRLAELPEDEAKLYFSPYGGTRATRPPLAYLVSAVMVKLGGFQLAASHPESKEFRLAARKGSALLAALAVMVLFQAFRLYSHSTIASVMLALIVGLLPQWTFIATYNNDDSAALLAGALILYSLLYLYRNGLTWPASSWLGLAAGIAILSKPTAWLLLPMLTVASLVLANTSLRDWLKKAALALLVLLLAGGWWPVWNMLHLGWDDPIQAKVVQRVAARHERLNTNLTFSYADKGIGAKDLILRNHNQFLTKTFISTVGNLDWMRLRVGPLQYGFYGLLFLLGFVRLLWLTGVRESPGSSSPGGHKQNLLGGLLLLGLISQLGGYLLANLYNDIQEQGKYLLPALGLLLLPLSILLKKAHLGLANTLCRWPASRFRLHGNCSSHAFVLLTAVILLIHLQALLRYVIPYYWPPTHRLQVRRMVPFNIRPQDIQKQNDIVRLAINAQQQIDITANGPDPWFILPKSYCRLLQGPNVLFRVRLQAWQQGSFNVFWETRPGTGFQATAQASARYPAGVSEFILGLSKTGCQRLRIDPMNQPGKVRILDMAAVRIDIDWPVAP